MYRVSEFNQEEQAIADFLSLPSHIYKADNCVQNVSEERELLTGKHVLSHYFDVRKFIVYDQHQQIKARCVITMYPGDKRAYLGFFECIEEVACCQLMLDYVASECEQAGIERLVGPVNCSFWIGYRMKVSDFEKKPYISEPYHPAYYLDFWKQAGFQVSERYLSNQFPIVSPSEKPKDYQRAAQRLVKQGYQLSSPKKADWEKVIVEIYGLISELYADFPIYKPMELKDFKAYFANYAHILDFSMVKMVYKNQQAVAFFISMPDYGNLLYKPLNLIRLAQLLVKRKWPKRYILLYMGVKQSNMGIGIGMIHNVMSELAERKASAIAAFIHSGKVTGRYWQQEIEQQYHYVLLERELVRH